MIHNKIVTIDMMVYFDYTPPQIPIIHLAPENCQPGFPAEVIVNEVYLIINNVESEIDVLSLLSDTILTELENDILENKEM